jgi:hypothetical protein
MATSIIVGSGVSIVAIFDICSSISAFASSQPEAYADSPS